MSKDETQFIEYVGVKRKALLEYLAGPNAQLDAIADRCFGHNTQQHVAFFVGAVAQVYAFLASTYARLERDFSEAANWAARTRELSAFLDLVLHRLEEQEKARGSSAGKFTFGARDLQWVMVASMLDSDAGHVRRTARLLMHPRIVRADDFPYELIIAALALAEEDAARRWMSQDPKAPLHRSLHGAFGAILDHDQEALNQWLEARVKEFGARSRKHTYEEHGCTKWGNRAMLDCFAIALCRIALARGLQITVASDYWPDFFLRPYSLAGKEA